ncbi:cobalamin biosynthesis protein CobG [Streptomyces sp. Qhu_M48]|uniref:cobalamin biosynthesis protein CobG n=1 Tax=Streptomyces sp. Qhu_M48 TaxID=3435889 RepID=UPI003F4F8141
MPPTPPPTPDPGEPRIRDRGDACPGALRLHSADDGRLARLRLPAGRLTSRQVEVLAAAAESLGDGRLSVTSRGNAELRGLADDCGAELAALLSGAGLLPSPAHERVRNIVASPAAGLDGLGAADVQLWARALDDLLCSAPWAAALSGRFLFVLDDGRGDVAGLGGDVTLVAEEGGTALLRVGSQCLRVRAADAPAAALAAARAFLTAAETAGTGAWRVRELPEGHHPDLGGLVGPGGPTGLGDPGHPGAGPVPVPPLPQAPPLAPGPLGVRALHVLAPLGRLTAAQLRALLPADEIRFTPWRGAVVVGADHDRLPGLAAHGLITRPDAPGVGVTACTGLPGCAKSLADVRADAARAPAGLLAFHYSGCERRCGHPHGVWAGAVATGADTYLVDGVPVPRTSLAEAVAAARAPSAHTTPTR